MIALTVSGVTFAVSGAQEAVESLDEPRVTETSSPPADAQDESTRFARPSRTAPTPRFALREKTSGKAGDNPRPERKPRPDPSQPPSKAASNAPSKAPQSPAPSRTQSQTPTPEPTPAEPTAPTVEAKASGSPILSRTNAARAQAGLGALSVDACLTRMAQQHAERVAAAKTLFHQDLGAVTSACGVSAAGENVAMNHTGPAAMVGQWLDSPGHRANLLNGDFALIGVGTARADDGAWYGVQVFGAK
jgi:uncharacterized protein YkwD